jgi:hypothetical protein
VKVPSWLIWSQALSLSWFPLLPSTLEAVAHSDFKKAMTHSFSEIQLLLKKFWVFMFEKHTISLFKQFYHSFNMFQTKIFTYFTDFWNF